MRSLGLTLLPYSFVLFVACSSTDSGSPPDESSSDDISGADASLPDSGADASPEEADAGAADAGPSDDDGPLDVMVQVFDEIVFYDGYAELVDMPTAPSVQRLRNDLITRRLEDAELDALQRQLRGTVTVGALCDNYDRIGSVGIALVPKGSASYVPEEVQRLELGRFITPFMDKNREPDEVHYQFDWPELAAVLQSAGLRARFDVWFELEVFGVPYAANQEIAGCDGRNDVFRGSLTLLSGGGTAQAGEPVLVPVAYKQAFNNYQEGASDLLGETRKTLPFVLEQATTRTNLVLITSNHGANAGGEEYERREHFVYVDGQVVLTYTPGRESCEPFRAVNTQANGIYGRAPRSDAEWQSFSNWCPGDVIDTRVVELGPLSAGEHTFVIDVPDARFAGADGNFPLSVHVTGAL